MDEVFRISPRKPSHQDRMHRAGEPPVQLAVRVAVSSPRGVDQRHMIAGSQGAALLNADSNAADPKPDMPSAFTQ